MIVDRKISPQGHPMIQVAKRFVRYFKKLTSKADLEDLYRDEFESAALASGDFKGVRFTRAADGKYVDARLESEWKTWVSQKIQVDSAI
jgi:hypothetical protein